MTFSGEIIAGPELPRRPAGSGAANAGADFRPDTPERMSEGCGCLVSRADRQAVSSASVYITDRPWDLRLGHAVALLQGVLLFADLWDDEFWAVDVVMGRSGLLSSALASPAHASLR